MKGTICTTVVLLILLLVIMNISTMCPEVLKSPKLLDSYEEIEAIERDELELSCVTGIDPPPNGQWFIGDREIRSDDYDYHDKGLGIGA